MKTTARFNRSGELERGAFTLIELIVVIAIIAALAALTMAAALKVLESQQGNNTQSILDQTQGKLGNAWLKVKNEAYKEAIPAGIDSWIRTNIAGNDPNATARVRVIYVKLKLRQAFPMNFNEALNPSPLPPLPGYVSYLNNLGVTGSSNAPYESSACLVMALQRGVSGAGINPDELGARGNTNGIPYVIDGWGRSIFFARFPTGCAVLNPNGAQTGANDPGDPQGTLNSGTWATQMPLGQQLFSQLTLQQLAPASTPPASYKLAPMVASGGPVNWEKSGQLSFHPTTFQEGYYTLSSGAFTASSGTGVMYSNP